MVHQCVKTATSILMIKIFHSLFEFTWRLFLTGRNQQTEDNTLLYSKKLIAVLAFLSTIKLY